MFDDIETARWGRLNYPGTGFLFYTGAANVTIDHNTLFNTGPAVYGDISANAGFVYRNNISPSNIGTADYQLCCSGVADNIDGIGGRGTTGNATVTLNTYFPGAVFVRNVLAGGGHSTNWPADNFFPSTLDAVGFVNRTGGDYHLSAASPYKNAGTDGKDLGADIDALDAATACAVDGSCTPTLDLVETAVSNPPASAVWQSSFAVTDTTRNQGNATAGSSLTRYYLSATPSKTSGATLLTGARSVPDLGAGESSSGTAAAKIPSIKTGPYFLLACANDTRTVIESDYANNCAASTARVVVSAPDLVEAAVSNPPASAVRGASFSVTDTTGNPGNATAGPSVTRYYLSATPGKTSGATLLTGSRSVPALGPGQSSSGTAAVKIPSMKTGSYFLLACANDTRTVAEGNYANNCKASATRVRLR